MNLSELLQNMVVETPAIQLMEQQAINNMPNIAPTTQELSDYDLMNQIGLAIKRR